MSVEFHMKSIIQDGEHQNKSNTYQKIIPEMNQVLNIGIYKHHLIIINDEWCDNDIDVCHMIHLKINTLHLQGPKLCL